MAKAEETRNRIYSGSNDILSMADGAISEYDIKLDELSARVRIARVENEFIPIYHLYFPKTEKATEAVLDSIRERLLVEMAIAPEENITKEKMEEIRREFHNRGMEMIMEELPRIDEKDAHVLAEILVHKSLGLGTIEIILKDENLEEIVINSAKEPVYVYHRKMGWLKTNITVPSEMEIYNYAASIGRKVGMQITNLTPLMDAYLSTGDRTNATLFPVSSKGNTLTIRKFAKKPWTIVDFISSKTLNEEVAAFLWTALQYEMNALIVGGTASGKTSLLSVIMNFIPPNHRIVSIEDTREIQLPDFLHWVPLTTRPKNPEGKGEITMLDLMVNSLRMRPDRIIVGEIRRSREAEVLFEAIHTGHSVYSTLHANTADETTKRLTNPPIDIPVTMLGALHLIGVMHRDRRREIRRVFEIAELSGSGNSLELNPIFKWIPSTDEIISLNKPSRILDELKLYAGMSYDDFLEDQKEKKSIIQWLVNKGINDINSIGRVVSEYYSNKKKVLERIKKS